MKKKAPAAPADTVDAYIDGFPEDVQKVLTKLRAAIRKAAPKATESISYRIPAYAQDGVLIYFAGFKGHVGVYPRAKGPASLLKKTKPYESGAGTYKFPLDAAVPYALVTEITKAHLKENQARAATKAAKAGAKKKPKKRA